MDAIMEEKSKSDTKQHNKRPDWEDRKLLKLIPNCNIVDCGVTEYII